MRQILRVALMVLLAAVTSVGSAWGEWKEYTDGNGVTWEYDEIEKGATCSIRPENRSRISGRVEIPGTVEVDGVSIKVVSIGESAFSVCSGLTAVTIPGSVTEIGKWAFSGCSGLKSIEVESGNKNYCAESGVLFTKDKATLVCYPGGKPEESYVIPSSVTRIGDWSFFGCTRLKAVTIPDSVTEIGASAFYGCSGLKSIGVESGNKNYCAESGVLFTKDKATLICYPGGKPEESYTIPSSVAEIGGGAFYGCSGLTAVTIPSSVTKIGEAAFGGCSGLTAVPLPGSVTKIGKWAFENCSGLKEVTIPSSVTKLGEHAFLDCSGLKSIEVESGNKNYCAAGGVLFTKDKATLICYPGGKPEESYTIPSSVAEIGGGAFYDCSGLTAVTIPSSVTKIGEAAFHGCSGLKAVTISEGVKTIGDYAFYLCSGLTAVTIPGSVTEIGKWAFSGCSGLTSVTISEGVKTIGDGAFEYCIGLTAVTIPGSVTEIGWRAFSGCRGLTAVAIPGSVTKIRNEAFFYCKGLTAVTIPGSVTEIGKWAFAWCSGLTRVKFPSGLKTIGGRAFDGCWGLTEVTIPSSVTEIGKEAFNDCSRLDAVYWLADANCSVEDDAFKMIAFRSTLYVRQGEKAAIEGNGQTWWKKFDEIVEGYVVTFQDWEGNKLGEQLVKPDGTATAPTAPTKEGYIVEWQLDGKKYDFSKPVTKNITLVAVWKQSYTVTFDAKGGTPTPDAQKVVKDGTATAPTDPTKKGYTFVEWQLDGAKYDFGTPVTKDITLVAVWKQKDDPKTAVESVQLARVRVVRNPMGEALELEGMERAARVEVYSVLGARVHAEALCGEPRVAIDARGWASGVYVVRVVASDGARTLRVVK